MKEAYGISKVSDANGQSFIVRSSLSSYTSKSTARHISVKAVTKGIEHYEIDGAYQALSQNNFIIVQPGQEVNVSIQAISKVEGICYYLDTELLHQIGAVHKDPVRAHLNSVDTKSFETTTLDNIPVHTFKTFLHDLSNHLTFDQYNRQQVSDFLICFAEKLVLHQGQTKTRINHLEGISKVTKTELYRRLQNGRRFIHDHAGETLTLKKMAREAGLSEYYFHRNFRSLFNLTPYQYHHEVRMTKASELLSTGHYSKKEIAFLCGFEDPKYFSKVLKKWDAARNLP